MNKSDTKTRSYILLFSGKTHLYYLKILKKDFRHCIVIMERKGGWLFLNPLRGGLEVSKFPALSIGNIAEVYTELGYKALIGQVNQSERYRRQVTNCVEVAKRVIGINAEVVRTPYQLYNYLLRSGKAYSFEREQASQLHFSNQLVE